MIIPSDIWPTWSNHDVMDANSYAEQRCKLWLANKCVSLWPQVFSWMVVNIYPANPEQDFRFEDGFADKAMLITFEWDHTGRGCNNASCYRTYPKGRMCTRNDPPVIFPSGEQSHVVACSPACYLKSRLRDLQQRLPADHSLFDQDNPRRCVECQYLSSTVTHGIRLRRLDGEYEWYDSRDGSRHLESPAGKTVGTPVRVDDEQNLLTDTDTPFLAWDAALRRCIIPNEFAFKQVVEPWWRDPSHSVCRVTNFRHGDDPVWGYRPKYVGQDDPKDFSFLVRHSRTYCRAFAKDWNNQDGSCQQTLLDKIISYTLAGDALQRWVKRLIDGDWGCADDQWSPIAGERDREVDPTILTSATHYPTWRSDINIQGFKLPPPNVCFSDLGIDVRLTGNRLYWNSHEGIVSQFPLFRAVDLYPGDQDKPADTAPHHPLSKRHTSLKAPYRNYNPRFYQKLLRLTSDNQKQSAPDSDNTPDNENRDNHGAIDKAEMDRTLSLLETALRQKRHVLETRLQEKSEAPYVLKADHRDQKWDECISKQLRKLRHVLSPHPSSAADNRHDDGNGFLHSAAASVAYTQHLPEYVTQQYLANYLQDDNPKVNDAGASTGQETKAPPLLRSRRSLAPAAPVTITPATTEDNHELSDLLNHINETKNTNQFWETMEELGIGVGVAVGEVLLDRALRYHYKKMLQFISHHAGGQISKALLKVGLRIGEARIAGIVASRLTIRALITIGSFASVAGVIIGVVQLLAFVFDIAGMSGWDPGNYNSETDLTLYKDIADFFNYAKQSASRGPLTPFELMTLLTSVNHSALNSERTDDSGTANIDESSLLFPSPSSKQDNEANKGNKAGRPAHQQNTALHIDQRVSLPKWFNRHWPQCFSEQNPARHLTLQDEQQPWLLIVLFDYLGAMTTNSYGQRIVQDPINIRLHDDDMARLFIEADYRDLTTRLSSCNTDNAAFNARVNSSKTVFEWMRIAAFASVIPGILCAVGYNLLPISRHGLTLAIFTLVFIVTALACYFSLLLLPVTPHRQPPSGHSTDGDSVRRIADKLRFIATAVM